METIFRFNSVADINKRFISALKTLFQDKAIEISVRTFSDETEFLLKNETNKNFLTNSIQDLDSKENLVSFSGSEYEALVDKLVKE